MKILESKMVQFRGQTLRQVLVEFDPPVKTLRMHLWICEKEEDHDFDNTGKCRKCGMHRQPPAGR